MESNRKFKWKRLKTYQHDQVRLGRVIREAVQKGSFAVITQKCNETANINVKKTAVYTQVNGE